MNVPHLEVGTDQPPLGGSCGIVPPPKSSGGELGGLFPPLPSLAKTHVVPCYVIVYVFVLIEHV
jgi:hypothetical protein